VDFLRNVDFARKRFEVSVSSSWQDSIEPCL